MGERTLAKKLGWISAAVCLLGAPAAWACSIATNPEHTLDEAEKLVDTTPPGPVEILSHWVHRADGDGNELSGCESVRLCPPLGSIHIQIVPAVDDRTSADLMGYRLSPVGDVPGELESVWDWEDQRLALGELLLFWTDGDSDAQGGFELTLDIQAVDLAGNLGPATRVVIEDPGRSGCATSVPSFGPCLALLGLLVLARHLRRHR